jgi:hypothetical protein
MGTSVIKISIKRDKRSDKVIAEDGAHTAPKHVGATLIF